MSFRNVHEGLALRLRVWVVGVAGCKTSLWGHQTKGEIMNRLKHWQDVVNMVIGVWLVVSAWALGLEADRAMTANFVIVGLALVALTLGAIFVPKAWEEWSEFALGIWLIVSPWVLNFNIHLDATRNAVACGAAVALLSIWSLLTYEDFAMLNKPGLR